MIQEQRTARVEAKGGHKLESGTREGNLVATSAESNLRKGKHHTVKERRP